VLATAELLLIAFLVWERRRTSADFIALIDRLCQRLQAPAAAVLEHDEKVRGVRPPSTRRPRRARRRRGLLAEPGQDRRDDDEG
jgi:hypothetical protein